MYPVVHHCHKQAIGKKLELKSKVVMLEMLLIPNALVDQRESATALAVGKSFFEGKNLVTVQTQLR